jgi:cyclophilin family peptidyl-prolyl cis-trans isomerase
VTVNESKHVPLVASAERSTSFTGAEQVLEPGADYRALLETSKGDVVIDLFEQQAPRTVNNFVFLAVNRYYDGVPFHRVLEDFMAQTGDPTGTGRGGPGYTFADEIAADLKHDEPGTVSMANAGPDTNGSQFFITFQPTPWLDGRHAVFGRVIEGAEVLDALQRIDPGRQSGATPDRIERVTILATGR